ELAASFETGVWTRYAGAFYLLNVALFLGLYGDFTLPHERRLALDPWDFAALVARGLLRTVDDRDPIWRVLADLSAQPGRLTQTGLAGNVQAPGPGAGFRAPRVWR